MKDSIQTLRRRLAETPANSRGRRRYSAETRASVVALAEDWNAKGKNMRALAHKLDMSPNTLAGWKVGKKSLRGSAIREVVVAPPSRSSLVIVLPSGARIENLDVREAAGIARELG